MVVALPCLVWAVLLPANDGVNLAWLPPAVGTACAATASLSRWWATRVPLFVATFAGLVVTGILAVPDDGGTGGMGVALPALLALVTAVTATLVALVSPFRLAAEPESSLPPRPARRRPQLRDGQRQ